MIDNKDLDKTRAIGYKIVLGIFTLIVGCNVFGWICGKFDVPEDNYIEELAEQIIESKLNISVDLTPNSLEDEPSYAERFSKEIIDRL